MCSKQWTKIIRNGRKKKQIFFINILSGPDNEQAEVSLEKFALKKSSNNEVSMHIQQEFMNALQLDSLIKTNEKKIKIALFPDILNWTTALGNWV